MNEIEQQVTHHPSKAKRTRRSHTDWIELVTQWKRSGLSQQAFCQAQHLCYRNFNQWKNRLAQESPDDRTEEITPSFIPITLSRDGHAAVTAQQSIHIALSGGITIKLEGGIHSAVTLIKALMATSC